MLVSGLSNTTRNLSDTLQLSCTFSGYPQPVITWSYTTSERDVELINNTERTSITSYFATYTELNNGGLHVTVVSLLRIDRIVKSDEGYYTCTAMESIFEMSNYSSGYLMIQGILS